MRYEKREIIFVEEKFSHRKKERKQITDVLKERLFLLFRKYELFQLLMTMKDFLID